MVAAALVAAAVVAGVPGMIASGCAAVLATGAPSGSEPVGVLGSKAAQFAEGVQRAVGIEEALAVDVQVGKGKSESAGVEAHAGAMEGASEQGDGVEEGDAGADTPEGASQVDDDPNNRVDPTQRSDSSFIYDTNIASLAKTAALYNTQTVQVIGEAIGDIIADETDANLVWVSLTAIDGNESAAISVLMTKAQSQRIDALGRYGVRGTILQVRGIYHQACSEHEGLSDVHADHVAVVEKGVMSPDAFDARDFVPGILLVVVGLGLLAAFHVVTERQR